MATKKKARKTKRRTVKRKGTKKSAKKTVKRKSAKKRAAKKKVAKKKTVKKKTPKKKVVKKKSSKKETVKKKKAVKKKSSRKKVVKKKTIKKKKLSKKKVVKKKRTVKKKKKVVKKKPVKKKKRSAQKKKPAKKKETKKAVPGSEIFKAYDVRGVYGTEIDEKMAYAIGRAFATYTGAKKILVGHDMRTSSPSMKHALVQGLTDQGADIVEIGLCSTPMFYYATRDYHAGVMVTASHNPGKYNGFKFCREHAIPIGQGTGMEQIRDLALGQKFPRPTRKGKIKEKEYLKKFITFSRKFLKTEKEFTVVVDAGNGMGGHTYAEFNRQLPSNIKIIPMYFELDGSFPNHEANPLKPENNKALCKRVKKENADLGVAIDGDGDRCLFIDERGHEVPSAYTASLIVEELMRTHGRRTKGIKGALGGEPSKPIFIYDFRCSRVLAETIKKVGAVGVPHKVGHAFIKKTMRAKDALFGAEVSGHLYHREVDYVENTFIPLCRILNIMGRTGKKMSELVAPLEKYVQTPETNFNLATRERGLAVMAKIEKKLGRSATSISHMDGVKLDFKDWWVSLRLSNTEPLLRMNLEADNERILKEKAKLVTKLIKQR